ncbi:MULTISPECIES: exodeoxyribonuclease VII large subunit [Exiguobacterium]|uniref:Exodeoxyribonuclease 7 large subunit n=2 Tax=Exiguobacterium artemiae TaxID=340145 RepID=EX7L_EXIS2|nr:MULTISPECIES: exodeoxyribonuclease VII large subunit [Exiguobacterium]B1YLQ2.1 RecName: Full=Exodeoxyribonuclease 7 large subunit; AltName: Full=Exodeoxyribonuclease VII large subunit; Short=Exonuclease VII large subunit [Exiguobacterium sibiricum 255-15]ACB60385.1 exodeoxyribonuclease VII, large subunit [Exiguobacterium sibiricum 255-15]HCN58940.1 exodeoxyribonuclease VII large subunit [Exiguobacterium sp.]
MTNPLQVSELVQYVKRELENDSLLQQVQVVGEVSNFKRHSSGHLYFTLKDEQSRMKAVMFARDASRVKTDIRDGARVIITARISVYVASGEMQLYVERMMEDGVGALYEAYVQLKEDVEARGWFEAEQKLPLPAFPQKIGIVTSPKGAALHDIATTLRRRYPQAAIVFAPVLVQGKEAAPQIVRAIEWMNEHQACDVMIIGRGGGSIEELWAFNEMPVVTAIHQSRIPIVSAVGHETDFTIADFVADVRAATPTAAAELVTPEAAELAKRLNELNRRLTRHYAQYITERKDQVQRLATSYGLKSPRVLLGLKQERLDRAEMGLNRIGKQVLQSKQQALTDQVNRFARIAMQERLAEQGRQLVRTRKQLERIHTVLRTKQDRLHQMIARLDSVSPTQVMLRGYTYVEQDGRLVRSVTELSDQTFRVQFHDGSILAKREDEEDGNRTIL